MRLRHYLLDHKVDQEMSVYNLGVSWATSADIVERFAIEAKARRPGVVVFAVGINDSCCVEKDEKNPNIELSDYRENMATLITQAKIHTDRIYCVWLTNVVESMVQPTPRSWTKYYSNSIIQEYNDTLQKVCKESNVNYIDVFGLIADDELWDGLHPDHTGHEKIFQRVKASIFI